ncbi:MAG: hypothetical protein ACE366_13000 [Bradymonadia bacterium]
MSVTENSPRKSGAKKPLKLKKAKKAAPKRGRKGKKNAPVEVTAELLAQHSPFSHLERGLLERLAPRVEHVELARGDVLYDAPPSAKDDASTVFVVIFGDVNVSRHDRGFPGPDIVNYLTVGEAFIEKLFITEDTQKVVLKAMCPAKVLKLSYTDINYLLRKEAGFREVVSESIRGVTERQQTRFDDDFRKNISQFIVQERLTFARRVKIKRMDICIECDGCYEACRDRHGTDRLGPSEVKFGLTEIPANCHNCVVPECIDKCKFGHISIHPETREIVIDDNCVGCTMCARGCSFDAIRMHSVEDLDIDRYFPDRDPEAKGKNIAQKCDNCTGYDDQACITACPTGAMFQVDGQDIFDHWQQFSVHHAPGFSDVVSPEGNVRGWRFFWVVMTLLNTLAVAWECFGRLHWPELTFTTLLHQAGFLKEGIDPLTPFRPGDFLSHALGYVGGGLCVATQLYKLGKWVAPKMGSVQVWMELHIFTGILGGIYGFFHTAFYFHGFVSIAAFATMMLAIVTGIVGRYIIYLIPRSQAGQMMALEELRTQIQFLNQEMQGLFSNKAVGHTMMMRIDEMLRLDQSGYSTDEAKQLLAGIAQLSSEDRVQKSKVLDLMDELKDAGINEGDAHDMLVLLKERARLERSIARHALMTRVLRRYRIVHVVSSNVMFVALAMHIVLSLVYRVGN